MKILIDENLSHKLARHLADLFPEMRHVKHVGMNGRTDTEVWSFARLNAFQAILTADADFQSRVLELGPPPKVIRIERCDFSTHEIVELLRHEAVRTREFIDSPRPLLILRR